MLPALVNTIFTFSPGGSTTYLTQSRFDPMRLYAMPSGDRRRERAPTGVIRHNPQGDTCMGCVPVTRGQFDVRARAEIRSAREAARSAARRARTPARRASSAPLDLAVARDSFVSPPRGTSVVVRAGRPATF